MSNWISHYSITFFHKISFFIMMILIFCSTIVSAKTLPINVYLKLNPDNAIKPLVQQINHYLNQEGTLSQYHLIPFINSHPLHVTLYLSEYNEKNLPQVKQRVQIIAKNTSAFTLSSTHLNVTPSIYVMLSVARSETLQRLSDELVMQLSPLHDKNATIPAWAKRDKTKYNAFLRYGSPNVFFNFEPHFSLMAASANQKEILPLHIQLTKQIKQFRDTHSVKTSASVVAIGIGIADKQGQITKELASYSLQN